MSAPLDQGACHLIALKTLGKALATLTAVDAEGWLTHLSDIGMTATEGTDALSSFVTQPHQRG
jgi:hypothetical protein